MFPLKINYLVMMDLTRKFLVRNLKDSHHPASVDIPKYSTMPLLKEICDNITYSQMVSGTSFML